MSVVASRLAAADALDIGFRHRLANDLCAMDRIDFDLGNFRRAPHRHLAADGIDSLNNLAG
jgi:hypothetical protein